MEEIKQFFVNYNELRGRKFKPLAEAGPRAAEKIIDPGMKTFKKQRPLKINHSAGAFSNSTSRAIGNLDES